MNNAISLYSVRMYDVYIYFFIWYLLHSEEYKNINS